MRRLRISRKASQRIEDGHVWVYRGETEEFAADAIESVLLCDERGRLLGSALVEATSPVPVRLYSRKEVAFTKELVAGRLEAALAWRRAMVGADSTGYRLVFSESDGLPGLIVDRFGNGLAVQCTMRNYLPFIDTIVELIDAEFSGQIPIDCIVREEGGARRMVRGEAAAAQVDYQLNGLRMRADLVEGPKTGAFLDQRENYVAARRWAEKFCAGGRALDLYSSSGGFALHVAPVVGQVDAVDSSAGAVKTIAENAKRNEIGNVRAIEADVKQFLRGLGQARKRYDCVIADPPAFAKSAKQKEEASRAYYDLNLRALSATASSGLFVSCSCSRAISEGDFLSILRQCAAENRRSLSVLEKRGQSSDHREALQIPETSYLKCFLFRVDD